MGVNEIAMPSTDVFDESNASVSRPAKRKKKESGSKNLRKGEDQNRLAENNQLPLPSSTGDIRNQAIEEKDEETTKLNKSIKGDENSSCSTNSEKQDHHDSAQLEIEAISHKERRKRRKLEKNLTTTPTGNTERESEKAEETRPEKVIKSSKKVETIFTTTSRSKYSIWVGNLLFTTTAQELARFFESCGKITRLNMPSGKKEHEQNKGFAYVDFETESGVDNAIEKSESLLGGRKLLIKRATDYSGRPLASSMILSSSTNTTSIPPTLMKSARKILDLQKQPPAPCLFFGNLGFETTSNGIMAMLQAHHQAQLAWKPKATQSKKPSPDEEQPENSHRDLKKDEDTKDIALGVRKVRMGTFEDSGKCKGFAFVDFESVAQATNALINIKNHKLDGRNLQVEFASADAVKRGGGSVKLIQHRKPPTNHSSANGDHQKLNKPLKLKSKPTDFEKPHPQTSALPMTTIATREDYPSAPPSENHYPFQHKPYSANHNDEQIIKPKKEYRGRQKPGAALANARRAPIGIIKYPDQCGKKTVFT